MTSVANALFVTAQLDLTSFEKSLKPVNERLAACAEAVAGLNAELKAIAGTDQIRRMADELQAMREEMANVRGKMDDQWSNWENLGASAGASFFTGMLVAWITDIKNRKSIKDPTDSGIERGKSLRGKNTERKKSGISDVKDAEPGPGGKKRKVRGLLQRKAERNIREPLEPQAAGKKSGWLGRIVTMIGLGVALGAITLTPAQAAGDDGDASSFIDGAGQSVSAFSDTIGTVLEGLIMVAPLLSLAGSAFGMLGKAIAAVGAIAMANPILLIVAAIAAAALLIIANWDKVSAFFSQLWENLKNICSKIKGLFVGLLPDWVKNLAGIGDKAGAGMDSEAGVGGMASVAGSAIKAAFPGLSLLSNVGDAIASLWKGSDGAVKNAAANMGDAGFGGYPAQELSPASAAPATNMVENTTYMGGFTFNVRSTDPMMAAYEIDRQLRSVTNTHNQGVKQGGNQ